MIQVLISFFIILTITYIWGYTIALPLGTDIDREELPYYRHFLYIYLGLMGTNVYAQYYSLTGGVGRRAFIICIIITIVMYILTGKRAISGLKRDVETLLCRGKRLKLAAGIFIILLAAYGSSRGYMHFDTNLYHAPAIRWIEEYGVVPGLANLQQRFGYNSAEFALNALFGLKWLTGMSIHATAGFFALLTALLCLNVDLNRISGFVRLGAVFYLCVIFGELVSPASDYYAQTLILSMVIIWLEAAEGKENAQETGTFVRTIIALILLYGTTIKLSTGLMVASALLPAIMLIRQRSFRTFWYAITSGIIVLLPFLIRNVLISGWLLYPSTAIDLFDVDWKVKKSDALFDAREIGVYGKGYTDISHYKDTLREWVPHWWQGLKSLEKLLVGATVLSILVLIIWITYDIIKKHKIKSYFTDKNSSIIPLGVIYISVLFSGILWFTSAPLIRYGYVYILLLPAMVLGMIKISFNKESIHKLCLCAMAIFLVMKAADIGDFVRRTLREPYYIYQQDYIDGEATFYYVDGIRIYVAKDAGQIGYYKFPSSPVIMEDLYLRGDDIADGFARR